MKKSEFIKELADVLEIEDVETLQEETNLTELEEYDSMAVVALIALVDEHFEKELSPQDLKAITTVGSLINLIGDKNFD